MGLDCITSVTLNGALETPNDVEAEREREREKERKQHQQQVREISKERKRESFHKKLDCMKSKRRTIRAELKESEDEKIL